MSLSYPAEVSENSLWWAILIAVLIDAPFLLIVVFSSDELKLVSLLIIMLPLLISGLIVYSSYASSKMRYILDDEELRISFPLNPLGISYDKISYVGKVETSLRYRLFGGSLPGSHWGFFSTSIGNTQVYTTKYKGEFVLIELLDGTRILISPKDPDTMLETLRSKASFNAPRISDFTEPSLDRRLAYAQVTLVWIAWLILFLSVASIYPGLPEVIPVHFGLNGVPNRYGGKVELLILLAISAIFPTLNTVFTLKFGKYNKGLTLFLSIIFLLAVGLFALIVYQILEAI